MYQSEALWINFSGSYPFALKVAAGKINAVTGEPWQNDIGNRPQDYLVVPTQPWLDGFCVKKGTVRQFVAMPLGAGYTMEEQLTGKAEFGGLQIIAYPMKPEHWQKILNQRSSLRGGAYSSNCASYSSQILCATASAGSSSMGMAPGGLMKQEIYHDNYGLDVWDTSVSSRCFIHLVNSEQYLAITGQNPPTKPPTASDYTRAGLPWFDYYGGDKQTLDGSQKLAGAHSVAAMQVQKGEDILGSDLPINIKHIHKINVNKGGVKDGLW
jgi:hypothetical protein